MLYIGADHRGYNLKDKIKNWLTASQVEFKDIGASALIPDDDYPDYAKVVGREVAKDPKHCVGLVICGSGVGVSVVANKFPRVRCGLVFTPEMARAAKADDNINVLAIASDFTPEEEALKIIETWLNTKLKSEEKYNRRIKKIEIIEDELKSKNHF